MIALCDCPSPAAMSGNSRSAYVHERAHSSWGVLIGLVEAEPAPPQLFRIENSDERVVEGPPGILYVALLPRERGRRQQIDELLQFLRVVARQPVAKTGQARRA